MLLRGLLFLAMGGALGYAHARAIAEGERVHRETGERARPTLIFVVRLLLLCLAFGVIAKSGSFPLIAALLGFVLARLIHRHRTRGQ
jgi:hypothetical protein